MCVRAFQLKGGVNAGAVVPCGKCHVCIYRRATDWTFRMMEEAKVSTSVHFITLTYEDNKLPWTDDGPSLYKKDLQDFWKRFRKNNGIENLKYYACGEYGTKTKRPHYHAIIYNAEEAATEQTIERDWKKGIVDVRAAKSHSMRYVANYIQKRSTQIQEKDAREKEFSVMSKGLGKDWLTKQMTDLIRQQQTGSVQINGVHHRIPRYYRDKVFTYDEKTIISEKSVEALREFQNSFDNPLIYEQWKRVEQQKHAKRQKNRRNQL